MSNNNWSDCDCDKCKYAFLNCKKKSQEEKIAIIKQEQINLLGGSEELYSKVNDILAGGFNAHFAKESFKLYEWRRKFFHCAFPSGTWVTDGNDDARMDAVPINIAHKFDEVVKKATLTRKPWEVHYFECWGESYQISRDFCEYYIDADLSFHHDPYQALQLLAVMFPRRPLKLEDLAIKKALEYKLPLDKFHDKIQYKASEVLRRLILNP